jgi:peptidoglycan/xylan/chitin deacetylase (PgdA/CDA1 family)
VVSFRTSLRAERSNLSTDRHVGPTGGLWGLLAMTAGCVVVLSATGNAYQPGRFYHTGNTKEKLIALTFDDGPGKFTIPILELLKQHNIRATFFMEGSQIEAYPKIAKQVVDAGHEIGNHTYNHFNYGLAKNAYPDRFVHELKQTEAALERAAGVQTKVVRMPHGALTKNNRHWLLPTLKENGYALVHWSFGTDWLLKKSAEEMAKEYIEHAKPGAVFLFHDGGRHREKTLAAVTTVIETLEAQGYRFIPAEEMFKE